MNSGEVNNSQTQFNKNEIAIFADYFSLLDQIDKRLQKEDPEYRNKYYKKNNERSQND